MNRAFAAIALSLCLSACQGKQADTGKAAAAAEVLPGSASDAMIAYDTVKSQPPLAVPTLDPAGDPGETRRSAGSETREANDVGNEVEPETQTAAPVTSVSTAP